MRWTVKKFLALAEKYTDFSVLTTPMINEFVDRIEVHAPSKPRGKREQQIDIYLNFIGNFPIPVQEIVQEETPEEQKLAEKRAKYRKKYQRRKELAALRAAETQNETI